MTSRLRNYPQSFLLFLFADALVAQFTNKSQWSDNKNYKRYKSNVNRLQKKGYVNVVNNLNGQKFLKLTEKGELELLMQKARVPVKGEWDGKWRIIFFDIPKVANDHRDKLRYLIKQNGFLKLQASVYISPQSLNRDAINYLKISGLIGYVRMGKVEELDDDRDLLKHFNLKK
jgi:DNA-binding transcriptional regulator PaaX